MKINPPDEYTFNMNSFGYVFGLHHTLREIHADKRSERKL